jgi:superfamily II DNA or RNA helicase
MEVLRKQSRSTRNKTAISLSQLEPVDESFKTIEPEKQPVAPQTRQNDKAELCFLIGREDARTFLRLKAGRQAPDFRYYTGEVREVLRDFMARQQEQSYLIDFDGSGGDEPVIFNPDERLIGRALSAGLLRDVEEQPLFQAEGDYRAGLYIEDIAIGKKAAADSGYVNISLALRSENDELVAVSRRSVIKKADDEPGEGLPAFYTLSPCFALAGNMVYRIKDLGSRWTETDRVAAVVQKSELAALLSLIYSTFTDLDLIYEGWNTRRIRPAAAQPALLFKEIDKYGYLHVKPLSFIQGFPSQFLENGDIISVADVYEADKTISIAEVVFPEPPEELFRSMLSNGSVDTALASVHEENGLFIIAPEFARAFFAENIFELSASFVLLESQVLARYKLHFARPKISFSFVSMGKGIDYLAGSADIEINGQTFSFARFMNEYRKASCITLADGTRAFPDKRAIDRLDRFVSQIKGEDSVQISFFDLPLLMEETDVEVSGAAWEDARAFFTRYNSIQEREGQWTLADGALRPYQEYGVRWLDYLREHNMGACLADEMGLGKTIQVIALLRALFAAKTQGKILILCPKTLVFNWVAELQRFAPELPVVVHYGTDRNTAAFQGKDFSIILSTYATLRKDVEDFHKCAFFYVILDESQNIKNIATQTTAAVLSLRAEHRLAMSGTPIENNLTELYSLFRFLNPAFFGSGAHFSERYLHPIQDSGNEEVLRDLKTRLYPFMLRRLKRDVLKDLPAKTEETAYIELEEEHLALYNLRRIEYKQIIDGIIEDGTLEKSSFIILKALSDLRRLASVPEASGEYGGTSAKRQYLMDMVSELVENGHKCLIFTNFLASVDLVSRDLADMNIKNITMTGETVDRQALVRRFQSDVSIKAFIMTLKTGGTGLNLTAADYIFILDPWWNSAAENQAVDRSHRIGQVNPVFCYRLIARNTIEERIMELQKRKTDLAGSLLSDDTSAFKSLAAEDVAYLVGGVYA